VATYLHCFDFTAADGEDIDVDSEKFGVTLVPKEQDVRIASRPAAALAKSCEGLNGIEHH
jgi:hypothetical protein